MRPRFTLFDKNRLQTLLTVSLTRKSTTNTTASTIFAVSSGRPPSAIAVIRISGSKAGLCLSKMTGRNDPTPSKLFFTPIIDARTGELLDRAMAVWMPGKLCDN
uniref:GTP-binding protein TrmE N-terminal domain-containing protein n=1 Tax=Plectus sambesii TaxID=2011161 RepID=A0A914WZ39_9BILA